MTTAQAARARAQRPPLQPATFTMVADGVRAQVVTRANILPAHLTTSAHEGRQASCQCWPLMEQLMARQVWRVAPAGTREACTQDEHDLRPLRACVWPEAPQALAAQAWHGIVEILLTMCAYCGAVEVRDTSYHQLAGVRSGSLATRRRSDILGWYAGKRPAGRVYT